MYEESRVTKENIFRFYALIFSPAFFFYSCHSNENGKNYIQWLIEKTGALQWHLYCSLRHVLHISSNVLPRHKFLRRRSLLVAVPKLAPPPLPPHRTWSDVHVLVDRLLGARRGDNRWMPNPIYMADWITPPLSKSWTCFTVWRAVGIHALTCSSHMAEHIKPTAFSSNC